MPKSQWISGEDLMKDWKIKEIELFDIVQSGLQPYDIIREPIPSPEVSEILDSLITYKNELNCLNKASVNSKNKYESPRLNEERNNRIDLLNELIAKLQNSLKKHHRNSWNNYDLPQSEEDAKVIFKLLKNSLFSKTDATNYVKSLKYKLPAAVVSFLSNKQLHIEVEMLYKALKRANLSSGNTKLREAAIKEFEDHRDKFKIIRVNYLTDSKLYSFRTRKDREDFIGQILQIILDENKLPLCQKGFLFNEYKRQIDNVSTKTD
jgi:hypothetical protein